MIEEGVMVDTKGYIIYGITGIVAFIAIILSIHLMLRHLNNWSEPEGQLSIVRIIMMIPIYSLTSWLAIIFGRYAIYLHLLRDSYESLVLYEFFCLIQHYFMKEAPHYFSYLGKINDRAIRTVEEEEEEEEKNRVPCFVDYFSEYEESPWPFPLCFLPNMVPGAKFFLFIKACVIQYVFIKPILSFLAVLLHMKGFYHTGYFMITDGYLWITILCNVSMTISLYMLIIFYLLISDVTEPHNPLPKFLSIKVLIFFIFWQSLLFSILYYVEVLPLLFDWDRYRSSLTLENLCICIEMLLLSVAHLWVYTYTPYETRNKQ